MKKYLLFAIILLATFSSCSFEDEEITYPYTSVYLPYQVYNRNIVVGEGLGLEIGVIFSGVLENNKERTVKYEIDPSLINTAGQSELPPSYYTIDGSEIRVPKGGLKGYLPVKLDSVAFLNDPKSLTGEYILPIRLVSSSNVDSINRAMDYMKLSVSYYAKQHGNYTYSGTLVKTEGGVSEEITYQNVSTVTNSFRFLKTAGPRRMQVVADATGTSVDPAKGTYTFMIEVATHGGGVVTITADPASTVAIAQDGECTYDVVSKTFKLNYKYTIGNATYKASENLVFRNRIRDVQADGLYINEWRGF